MATTYNPGGSPYSPLRSIPLMVTVLITLALYGPLLAMQLPAASFDANFHIFFASHYAHHWFNPWNEKWFAGFSQTTYPPLTHQWIALVSNLVGLNMGYMLVQLVGVLLLPVGVYRFAKLWVNERAASFAGLGSAFLGVLAFLVFQAGQLATVTAAALLLNALPYLYEWITWGHGRSFVKGLAVTLTAAAAHHVTLLFGAVLFAGPVFWLACLDASSERERRPVAGVIFRTVVFTVLAAVGVGAVLLPYWISIIQHPIQQAPIPHDSRANYLLNSITGTNYFLVPYGTLILALPFIFIRGAASPRLRPLMWAFWLTFLLGLGGTTPVPRWLLGRAFEVLTFERFSFWAALLAMPLVGLLAQELLDRFHLKAAIALAVAAVFSFGLALAWLTLNPFRTTATLDVRPVVSFLNRDGHDRYRYLVLGFGSSLSKVSTYTDANTVDGDYNSARLLPEMTSYGSAQLNSAKFYGNAGMAALRAMLEHANRYGLKFVFVHDPYYEPLLTFAGWRKIETYDNGEISAWSREDVPPARRIESDAVPATWEGLMWGILPVGSSLLAIALVLLLPTRQRVLQPSSFHAHANETYVA
jgi:hypothetical protein